MQHIKKALLLAIALSTGSFAGFDFGECSGSGTFSQAIESYNGDNTQAVTVGEIPAGIQDLQIELISDKDVDIRLYGANGEKIVVWPDGLINTPTFREIEYHGVTVSYSGYNGIDGEKGHETIAVEGSLPETVTMKAFGYEAGDATVNYSWSGKDGCTGGDSGTGTFNQAIPLKAVTTIGTIPPGISNLEINLTAPTDLDIQLFGADGTEIVMWPSGLINAASYKEIDYNGMHIVYSGYNGVDGQKGHEYIKVTNATTETLTMKAYGFEAGEAVVNYSWGNDNGGATNDWKVTLSPAIQTVITGENGSIAVMVVDANNPANGISGKVITLSPNTGSSTSGTCTTSAQGTCTITVTDTVAQTVVYTPKVDGATASSSNTATVNFDDTNDTIPLGKLDGVISKANYVAAPTPVIANGNDFTTYTLTLKDYLDVPINTSVNHVVVTPSKANINHATIEAVDYSRANEGIYTFKVRDTVEEPVSIKACVESNSNNQIKQSTKCYTEDVNFKYPDPSKWKVTLSPDTQNVTVGPDGTTISVKVVDVDYSDVNITGKEISLIANTGSSTFNSCTTDMHGECTITVSDTVAETVVYTPRANGTIPNVASNTANVEFTPGTVNAGMSTVTANPTRLVADGVETSTIVVTAKDIYGNLIDDATVSLSQGTGHSTISDVTNNNNGTYNFSVSNATIETVVYRARMNAVNITQNVSVIYDETTTVAYIASIYDNTPYNPAIDYQGIIDGSGYEILLPYTVSQNVFIPAYSQSKMIDASKTSDDESGLGLVLSYPAQILTAGSGEIVARITVNDIQGNEDGEYHARQIDVDAGITGVNVVSWSYSVNTTGLPSYATLKIIAGIPDRMFGKADNNGDTNSHNFLYLPVTNPTTGKTWLNNNLGADYTNINHPNFNPAQQAKSLTDYHAYGSLFQWGRKADGHELINWTAGNSGTPVNGTTTAKSDDPIDTLFITAGSSPYDWRVIQDSTLWAGVASANNVCPAGYRLPSGEPETGEWTLEVNTWSSQDSSGALSSLLRLPAAGIRHRSDADLYLAGKYGYYWSASVSTPTSRVMRFNASIVNPKGSNIRAHGFSIRCLKN